MRHLVPLLFFVAALLCFHRVFQGVALADDAGSGSGSAASSPAPAAAQPTADQLPDPVSSPGAAFDDLKAAKKLGWLVAVLAGLVLLGKLLSRASSTFSFLGKGKAAVVIAVLGTTAAGCYNAAVLGGSWTAIALAAIVGLAHYKDAAPASS